MDPASAEPAAGLATGFPDEPGWQMLAPAARTVRAMTGAIAGSILAVPAAAVLVTAVGGGLFWGLLTVPSAVVVGALLGVWAGQARWRRTRWKLDHIGLHVRRGLIWHTEVLVPRSRVQHLDVERGPLERHFGLATLVVHTAGTQTHALRQSGFEHPDATALRDALIPDAARHVDAL